MKIWLCPWSGIPLERLRRNSGWHSCIHCRYGVDDWYPKAWDTHYEMVDDFEFVWVNNVRYYVRKWYEKPHVNSIHKTRQTKLDMVYIKVSPTVGLDWGFEWHP